MKTGTQVSVAILLDKFVSASALAQIEKNEKAKASKKAKESIRNVLDPLLEKLTREYIDDVDLSSKLQNLFKVLDTDDSKEISPDKLCAEIKKLNFQPRIHMTGEDFATITGNGALCNEEGKVGPVEFEEVIRLQIRRYTQRQLADLMVHGTTTEADYEAVRTLKLLLTEQLEIERRQDSLVQSQLDQSASQARIESTLALLDSRLRDLLPTGPPIFRTRSASATPPPRRAAVWQPAVQINHARAGSPATSGPNPEKAGSSTGSVRALTAAAWAQDATVRLQETTVPQVAATRGRANSMPSVFSPDGIQLQPMTVATAAKAIAARGAARSRGPRGAAMLSNLVFVPRGDKGRHQPPQGQLPQRCTSVQDFATEFQPRHAAVAASPRVHRIPPAPRAVVRIASVASAQGGGNSALDLAEASVEAAANVFAAAAKNGGPSPARTPSAAAAAAADLEAWYEGRPSGDGAGKSSEMHNQDQLLDRAFS